MQASSNDIKNPTSAVTEYDIPPTEDTVEHEANQSKKASDQVDLVDSKHNQNDNAYEARRRFQRWIHLAFSEYDRLYYRWEYEVLRKAICTPTKWMVRRIHIGERLPSCYRIEAQACWIAYAIVQVQTVSSS